MLLQKLFLVATTCCPIQTFDSFAVSICINYKFINKLLIFSNIAVIEYENSD